MGEQGRYTKLHIYDFGPFKEAHVELAPLTIFIGKNSLGKSMLLYLIWVLEKTAPKLGELYKIVDEHGGMRLAEKCFDALETGRTPDKLIRQLILVFIKAFPQAWTKAIEEETRRTFGASSNEEIIRLGASRSRVIIDGRMGEIELTIDKKGVLCRWKKLNEDVVNLVEVEGWPGGLTLDVREDGGWTSDTISSHLDLLEGILWSSRSILREVLGGLGGTSKGVSAFLVDGRSGVERIFLTGHPNVEFTIRDILSPDLKLTSVIRKCALDYTHGLIDLNAPALALLLNELGFELDIRKEFGVPRIFVRSWSGMVLPLERSPSGVREIIPIVLSLLDTYVPIIYIEEPEAHLHPKAIRLVPRLMAYAINKLGKHVRITTHSDILISQINNLIAMSADPEGARELSYEPSELLKPGLVRAYWLRRADGHVEVVELPVNETGFDEVEFAEVAEDLFVERSEVYRLLGAKEKEGCSKAIL